MGGCEVLLLHLQCRPLAVRLICCPSTYSRGYTLTVLCNQVLLVAIVDGQSMSVWILISAQLSGTGFCAMARQQMHAVQPVLHSSRQHLGHQQPFAKILPGSTVAVAVWHTVALLYTCVAHHAYIHLGFWLPAAAVAGREGGWPASGSVWSVPCADLAGQ